MNIVLIRDPDNNHGYTWEKLLRQAGHQVIVVEEDDSLGHIKSVDICLPLVSIRDFQAENIRYKAAVKLERAGVPMVNSTSGIAISSDKWQTYEKWKLAGLLQPKTFLLQSLTQLPDDITKPFISKPRFGHSGKFVRLVNTVPASRELAKCCESPMLIQEYVEQPKSIRAIASNHEVLACYERMLPGSIAANVALGATRHYFEPSEEMKKLATTMVSSLGGNLMGVDILEKDGELYALEANVPFGFDPHNKKLQQKLIEFISSYFHQTINESSLELQNNN